MHLSLFIEQKLTSYLSAILNALFVRNVVKKKVVLRCLYNNTLGYCCLPFEMLLMRLFVYFNVNRRLMLCLAP